MSRLPTARGAGQRVLSRGAAPDVPALHPSPGGALPRRAAGDRTPRHPLARDQPLRGLRRPGFSGQEQVVEAIDLGAKPGEDHGGRAVLLDDRWRADDVARLQAGAIVDRAVDGPTVESDET